MPVNHEKLTEPSKTSRPVARPSQLGQSQEQAEQAAEKTKIALVTGHQENLVKRTTALDKAEQRRNDVVERLSDRVAYLQDENMLMHDILTSAQRKLKGDPNRQENQTVTVTAIDALCDAFDVIGDWDLPAIAPTSVMGALPF
jgi:hypothetical protein